MPIQPNPSSKRTHEQGLQPAGVKYSRGEVTRGTITIGDISFAHGAEFCDRPDELRVRIDATDAAPTTLWCRVYIGESLVMDTTGTTNAGSITFTKPLRLRIAEPHYVKVLAGFPRLAPVLGQTPASQAPAATRELRITPRNPYADHFHSVTEQLGSVIRNSLDGITVNGGSVRGDAGTFTSRDMNLTSVRNIAFSISVIFSIHLRHEVAGALSQVIQAQFVEVWDNGYGTHFFPGLQAIPPGNLEFGPVLGTSGMPLRSSVYAMWPRHGLDINIQGKVRDGTAVVANSIPDLTPCEAEFVSRTIYWFRYYFLDWTLATCFHNLTAFGTPAIVLGAALGGPALSGRIVSVGPIFARYNLPASWRPYFPAVVWENAALTP